MKLSIKKSLQALLVVPVMALSFGVLAPAVANAQLSAQGGADAAQGEDHQGVAGCLFGIEENCEGETSLFRTITNILLFIIGAIAVIMLVIGGIRYTISGGDSTAVSAAKNTILYSVIGIIVAILAYAIVNFVIGGLAGGGN